MMRFQNLVRLLSVLVLLGVVSLDTNTAQARRRGAIVINTGGKTHDLGEITPSAKARLVKLYGPDVKVGYVHERFGLFWLDIFCWDGSYAVYSEDATSINAEPISAEQAASALGISPDELSPPLSYTLPPGMFVFPILGCVSAFVAIRNHNEDVEAAAALEDITEDLRYQEALRIVGERMAERDDPATAATAPADGGMAEGVEYLVQHGIPREAAEENLEWLVNAILQGEL